MKKRNKVLFLRAIALFLFATTIINSVVTINAHTPEIQEYSMEEVDALAERTVEVNSLSEENEENSGDDENEESSGGEEEGNSEDEKGADTNEDNGNNDTTGSKEDELTESTPAPAVSAAIQPTPIEEIVDNEGGANDIITDPSATPDIESGIIPDATPSPSPEKAEEDNNKASLKTGNGGIKGEGLEALKISLDTSELAEGVTFGINIDTEAAINVSGIKVDADGAGYRAVGLNHTDTSFSISGLENQSFHISAGSEGTDQVLVTYSSEGTDRAMIKLVSSNKKEEADQKDQNKISEITAGSKGITGNNLETLQVNISYKNESNWGENDSYEIKLESANGEEPLSGVSISSGLSMEGTDGTYTISGISKNTTGFTLNGLDNKKFILKANAASDNEGILSFSYHASLDQGSLKAAAEISVEAAPKEDEKNVREVTADSSSLPAGIDAARAVFDGAGMPEGTKLVIKRTVSSDAKALFASYISEHEYQLADQCEAYLFDISFTDKEGKQLEPGQKVTVTLTFADPLYSGNEEIRNYLVLHQKGSVEQISSIAASKAGLKEVVISSNAFSPFSIVPVTDEAADKEPVDYNMEDWINQITLQKKNEDGGFTTVTDSTVLSDKDYIKVNMTFTVPNTITFTAKDTVYYNVPAFLYNLTQVESGIVKSDLEKINAGTYTLKPGATDGGKLTVSFYDDYLKNNGYKVNSGTVTYEGYLKADKLNPDNNDHVTLKFGECEVTIKFVDSEELEIGTLDITKKYERYEKVGDEEYLLYKITVKAPKSNTKAMRNVVVTDQFVTGANAINAYSDSSLFTASAGTVKVSGKTFTWEIGDIAKPAGKDITETLTYKVLLNSGSSFDTIKNTATVAADNWKNSAESSAEIADHVNASISKALYKGGKTASSITAYDKENKTITYRVTITADKANTRASRDGEFSVRDLFTVNAKYVDSYVKSSFQVYENNSASGSAANMSDIEFSGNNGFVWSLKSLEPGASRTLEYTVKIVDHSDTGNYEADDIWTNGTEKNSNRNLKNEATLFVDDKKTDKSATATVNFAKSFIWKSAGTVNTNKNTIDFEVHANETNNANTPFFNVGGWKLYDKLTADQWKFTGDVVLTAYTKGPNSKGSPVDSRTYTIGKAAAGWTSSDKEFTLIVPQEFSNYYIELNYSITPTTGFVGNASYKNKISFGPEGSGSSIPMMEVSGSGGFSLGVRKESVSHDETTVNWKSEILANVANGDTFKDEFSWNANYQKFTPESLNLKLIQGSRELREGTDYECSVNDGSFVITFKKSISASEANPIIVTYSSLIVKEGRNNAKPLGEDGYYTLKNKATLIVSNGTAADEGSIVYYVGTDIIKTCNTTQSNFKNGEIIWDIKLNKKGNMSGTAYVKEVLPKGLEFKSAEIVQRGANASDAAISHKEQSDGSILIEVKNLKATMNDKAYVDIRVVTKVVDEDCLLGKTTTFENAAYLVNAAGETLADSKADITVKYKSLTKSGKLDSDSGRIVYSIIVNPEAVDLLKTGTEITIVDKMSDQLIVDMDTLKVVNETTGEVLPVKPVMSTADNSFSLNVPDNAKISITYETTVKGQIGETANVTNRVFFYGKEAGTDVVEEDLSVVIQDSGMSVQTNKIYLKKIDQQSNVLGGAEFKISKYENGKWIFFATAKTSITGSGYDGLATVAGISAGELYSYQETKAPQGYVLDETVHYFWITDEKNPNLIPTDVPDGIDIGPAIKFGTTLNVVNKKISFMLQKTDEANQILPGAEFTLRKESNVISIQETNGKGQITFEDLDTDAVYYLEETKAPDNYVKLEAPYKLIVDKKGNITAYKGELKNGSIVYEKAVSLNENLSSGYDTLTIKNSLESGKAELSVTKIIQGRTWKDTDSFDFKLSALKQAPMPGGSRNSEKTVTASVNKQTVSFGEIDFNQNGTYEYTIEEIIPDDAVNNKKEDITYSTEIVYLQITVRSLADGSGKEIKIYTKSGTEGYKLQEGTTVSVSFTNVADPVETPSATPTGSPTPSVTPTGSPEGSATPSVTPTGSPEGSATPSVTPDTTPTGSPEGSATPSVTPEATPGSTPAQTPDTTPESTPEVFTEPTPETVPSAAPEATPEGSVLGARRTNAGGTEAAVLGAKRGTDYAVLGKRRRPTTGDSAEIIIWVLVLSAAVGGAIVSGVMMYQSRKKKDNKNHK